MILAARPLEPESCGGAVCLGIRCLSEEHAALRRARAVAVDLESADARRVARELQALSAQCCPGVAVVRGPTRQRAGVIFTVYRCPRCGRERTL